MIDVGRLAELHYAEIRNWLTAKTRRPDLAEDLAQDVFLKAHRFAHTYDERGRARAWLYRIATSVLVDHIRVDNRGRSRDISTDQVGDAPHVDADPLAYDDLLAALEALPPLQSAAVELFYLHGYSERETGTVIGASEAAVKKLKSRGLFNLRLRLDEAA